MYKIYSKDKENAVNRDNYLNYSKILTKIINRARVNHEKNKITAIGNNTKKIWDYVNDKIKGNAGKKQIECIIDDDENKIENVFEIANAFNDFYTNVGVNLAIRLKSQLLPLQCPSRM